MRRSAIVIGARSLPSATSARCYMTRAISPPPEPLCREALEVQRETLGGRHPDTLTSINNLGILLQDKGDLTAAEPLLREVLEGQRETLGSRHPSTLASNRNLELLLKNN